MEDLKQRWDNFLQMVSILRYYDEERQFATLHYHSPSGEELLYIAFKFCGDWEPIKATASLSLKSQGDWI